MDDIPEELIDMIVPYITGTKYCPVKQGWCIGALATVSAKWQRVIERQTFKHLILTARAGDGADYGLGVLERAVLSNPRRRSYLRFLQLNIVISDSRDDFDLGRQRYNIDLGFGTRLARLFAGLASAEAQAEADGRPMGGLELVVTTAVRDSRRLENIVVWSRINRPLTPAGATGDDGWDSPPPPPPPPLLLPTVRCVSSLTLFAGEQLTRPCMRTALDMARSLPALSRLDIHGTVDLCGERDMATHSQDRRDLAGALVEAASSPPPLRHASLLTEAQDRGDLMRFNKKVFPDFAVPGTPSAAAASAAEPTTKVEPLGPALRTWSHNPVSLELCGLLDGSLLSPHESEPSAATLPSWPNLKNLSVKLRLLQHAARPVVL